VCSSDDGDNNHSNKINKINKMGGLLETHSLRAPLDSGVLHTATNPAGPYTPQSPPGMLSFLKIGIFVNKKNKGKKKRKKKKAKKSTKGQ